MLSLFLVESTKKKIIVSQTNFQMNSMRNHSDLKTELKPGYWLSGCALLQILLKKIQIYLAQHNAMKLTLILLKLILVCNLN